MDATTSEGVALINANDWHTAGYTGAGVKIAILDGGFSGYTNRRSEGELPTNLITQWFRSDGVGTSVHGTACAEIVYDMAPGAQLYLVSASTDVEMGVAVAWLIAQDVDIISFSAGFLGGGPGNGTGPICEIVDEAEAAGILWVNAAGNYGERHWSGNFIDVDNDGNTEFSPGDEGNAFSVTSGQTISAALTWNDLWGSSTNDYDLSLLNGQLQVVASSSSIQDGDDPPLERLTYTATAGGNYVLAIRKKGNPLVRSFHLYSAAHSLEHRVASGSLCVPADSPNALTVGAVPWNSPTTLEIFSSQGPTTDNRIKPDLVAPDGVSTVSYGTGVPFFGTSAATPHVAGAAGLVKCANPTYSPAQIQSYLEDMAVDLGSAGKDNLFGDGRVFYAYVVPTVVTSPPTNLTQNSARLNGNLTDRGSAETVTVSFNWGTDTNYTGGNVSGVPVSLTEPGIFVANLTGLTSGRIYHYRAKAIGSGVTYGNDIAFTAGSPRLVFTSSSQSVMAGQVSGNFTIQTRGADDNPLNVSSETIINLSSSSPDGKFDTSVSGNFTRSSVTITNGSSSRNFYYRDATAGSPTITASSSGYTNGTQQLTVTPGTAFQVRVETAANGTGTVVGARNLNSGSNIIVYGVSRDQYGNYIGNPANTTWSLTNRTGGVAITDLSASSGASVTMTGHLVYRSNSCH
jgi:hypothetical protein